MSALGPVAVIAASGMAAAQTRMDVAAQNLANMNSQGAVSGSPYRPQRADLISTIGGGGQEHQDQQGQDQPAEGQDIGQGAHRTGLIAPVAAHQAAGAEGSVRPRR